MKTFVRDVPADDCEEHIIAALAFDLDPAITEITVSLHRGSWLVELRDGQLKDAIWRALYNRGYKAIVQCWDSEARQTRRPDAARKVTRGARKQKAAQRSISPATPQQRDKVRERACIVCTDGPCHPAHLIDRSIGGGDDVLDVVALCPTCHRAYDDGQLSLLEHLEPHWRTELAAAVERVGLVAALNRITNERWTPERTS